jgi:hypothetical protein
VWIPQGTFRITSALQVNKATIVGAGSWYSQLATNEFINNGSAVPGPVNLSGFAILGSTVGRHDDSSANAINGSAEAEGDVALRLRARSCDHVAGAQELGDLHRVSADAAGRSRNEHAAALLDDRGPGEDQGFGFASGPTMTRAGMPRVRATR